MIGDVINYPQTGVLGGLIFDLSLLGGFARKGSLDSNCRLAKKVQLTVIGSPLRAFQ